MMKDLVLRFEDVDLQIVDHEGEKWVTATQLSRALGYVEASKLRNLIKRNKDEFSNKISGLKLSPLDLQENMVINYHGVIRAAMLSDAPRAKEFRDWAEGVLLEVMVTGAYNSPAFVDMLKTLNEAVLLHGRMLEGLQAEVHEVRGVQRRTLIVGRPDTTYWWTAGQRARHLIRPSKAPKGFNLAGAFDWYAAQRHYKEFGAFPEQRSRRHIYKLPEYVYEPCPEMDQFLRDCYRRYIKHQWPTKQGRLALVAGTGARRSR